MIWLIWRQHRAEFTVGAILLFLVALVLLITGINIISMYHSLGIDTCLTQNTNCELARVHLNEYVVNNAFGNQTLHLAFIIMLLALPLIAGLFIGAPIVAREIESGTYRLIWTQSITPLYWLLLKIGALTGILFCAFVLLWLLLSWWSQPATAALATSWGFYDIIGIVPLVYGIFALMLGVFAGVLIRRTVPAIAITLFIFIALRLFIELFWRPYFLMPNNLILPYGTQSSTVSPQDWIISRETVDRQGNPLSSFALSQLCNDPTGKQTSQEYDACITKQGLSYHVVYQPANRFWVFQIIEFSIYLIISLLLLSSTLFWIKHKIL